jgi:exopolysaccharide biosynthesis polyprenyl glycosylphosphotransferase
MRTPAHRRQLVQRILAGSDVAALLLSYATASLFDPDLRHTSLILFALALPLWVVVARACRLYDRDDRRLGHSTLDELAALAGLLTAGTWCGLLLTWAASRQSVTEGAAIFWGASIVLVVAGRATARAALHRRRDYPQRTVIVGAGDVGQLLARKLVQHPEWGLQVLGFVDSQPRPIRSDLGDVPVLGTLSELAAVLAAHDADRLIVAFSHDRHEELAEMVYSARRAGVCVDVVPRLFDMIGPAGDVNHIEGFPLVSIFGSEQSRVARFVKRALDIAVATSVLLLTLPLFAWIAWRIKRDSPGPVFFRQVRLGEGQRRFTLLKFRTMTADADEAPHREYVRQIMHPGAPPAGNGLYKLDRSNDVTKFGIWLRRTSLDELPQLLNVVRGEMSLVGPRPCLAYETELFEAHHFDRFLVPAGMTGLWQVTARARATLKEALDLDAAYAHGWSLGLDLWVLARTPLALLRGGSTT